MNTNSIRKRIVFCIVFSLLSTIFAQQITKFGVVDTAKIYQAYYRNSSGVRNYEAKKAEFQTQINKMTEELQSLNQQKKSFLATGNRDSALQIEAEINQKADYLKEYSAAKNTELESLRNSMQDSDSFYKKLYATLGHVAESGGYSMILSLQQANAILWYSPSVDLTQQVIEQLGL